MARPRLTVAQRQALAALDPAVPRHPLDLRQRDGVRLATLASLCVATPSRPPLARLLELKPAVWLKVPYIPFYLLTLDGAALRR